MWKIWKCIYSYLLQPLLCIRLFRLRVPVSSAAVPRSIKRLLHTTQKGKGGLPKPPALLTQQGPCMALWARQAWRGGEGSVLQQTFTTFPPSAELCQCCWHWWFAPATRDAAWAASVLSRWYLHISTVLLSLLNPWATGNLSQQFYPCLQFYLS